LQFFPKEEGNYNIEIKDGETVLAESGFTVKAKTANYISLDKKEYQLGENVTIYLSESLTNLSISSSSEIFFFDNPNTTIVFTPQGIGLFTIAAYPQDAAVQTLDFYVKGNEEKNNFTLDQDVTILFDLAEKVDAKKTLIDRIFGLSPIKEVTAYVVNHSDDNTFNLSIEKAEKEQFLVIVMRDLRQNSL